MLGEKFKDMYNEWAGTSSRSLKGPGKYFQAIWDMMGAMEEIFARIGYNRHAVQYTLYVCEDHGFDHGLDDSEYGYDPEEAWRRRQVVAHFLRLLAEKIEEGEC